MNTILLTVSVVLLVIVFYSQHIKYKRFKYSNKLGSIYDQMELYVIENNIILNNDRIEFLKIFKNLSLNPDFLDIQVLLLSKIAVEKRGDLLKNKEWFEKTLNSFGAEFKNELYVKFDFYSHKIVLLSFRKPDFIWFYIKILCYNLLNTGINAFKKIRIEINYAKSNEEVITYSGMQCV